VLDKPPFVNAEENPAMSALETGVVGMVSEHIVVARYELGQGYSVLVRHHRLSPSKLQT